MGRRWWMTIALLTGIISAIPPLLGPPVRPPMLGCLLTMPGMALSCLVAFVNGAPISYVTPAWLAGEVATDRTRAAVQDRSPLGIAVGPDGDIWFAERAYRAVGRISMQGDIHEFPLPAPSTDVAEGPDGNIWTAMPDAIGRITPQGAVKVFPLETGHNPSALTADRDGAVWFTEGSVDRLGRINMAGNVTETVVRGRGAFPQGLVTGPAGGIWFTHTIEIGHLSRGGGLGLHGLPTLNDYSQDICVGPDKNLWFTVYNERNLSWIGQLTEWDGRIKQFKLDNKSDPLGISAGPDGNLWFTEERANRIGKLSVTGEPTLYNLPHQASLPAHIVTGPDGNLWFTEEGRDTIGRITPEGKITEFPIPGGVADAL